MTNQEKLLRAFKERKIDDFRILLNYRNIDVDYFYEEPDNGTLLDLTSTSEGNEQYIIELIKRGAKVWSRNEETDKLEINEIFNSSDRHLLYNIWCCVYSSSRSGNGNANIMEVAVEENDIEAIELLARSYSILVNNADYNHHLSGSQHLILLQGSIDAVRLFIKYFDVDNEFKYSQGHTLSCREIILQRYPKLKAELTTQSPRELHKILFSYLEKGVPELFVKRIADISAEDRLDLILLQGSIDTVRLFIKYFNVDKEFQIDSDGHAFSYRDVILQKYPELKAELLIRSSRELQEILFSYLERGVPELFIRRIADISTEILNDGRHKISKKTYLHVACERNYIDVVEALLEKNIQVNEVVPYFNEFAQLVTPIMVAAFRGHYEIFRKLFVIPEIELQNKRGSGSVLHLVLRGMRFALDQNYPTHGHCMILELLLTERDDPPAIKCSRCRLNIEHTDKRNRTALHYALKFNNEFAIKLLLGAGAKLYDHDRSILTSISAKIIEGYFDDCIRSTEGTHWTQGYTDVPIIFHYKIFRQLDLYSIANKSDGNFYMRKLYKHPLTKSWFHLIWCIIRKCYYVNLAFYLSFCFALSTYIFQTQHCQLPSTNFNGSGSTDTEINRDASSILCDLSLWIWLVTSVLYIILIIRELCQLSFSIRVYFGIPENWLEMTMIVEIGFLFANYTNTQLAATAILMSWIEFILLLGKQPSLSIYIEMFKTVALNFAKFLLLYSVLVASFAYSFFILFRNKTSERASSQNQICVDNTDGTNENSMNSWQDLQMSFFKSIVMMTGEFDASTLPLDSNFGYGHALFILFVFLVSMVIYSLLNGLAVSDTRSIMDDAEIVALISRVKLIYQISKLERVFAFLYNKLIDEWACSDETERVYVYPTKSNTIEINSKNVGKMPSSIVRYAQQILEKRKQSELAKNRNENLLTDVTKSNSSEHQLVNKLVRHFSEQIINLKLEIDAKNTARDEKLLQSVDQRFDKMMNGLLDAVRQEVHLKNKN